MSRFNHLIAVGIGFVGGMINGLLGVGGGTLLIPGMVALLKVGQHQAHGTSLSVTLPTAILSAFVYSRYDIFDLGLAVKIAIGGTVGGYLGAKLMEKMPDVLLRKIFAIVLILTSIRMVL
jgi:hypothetical protein